jgi:membrane carboxypeptidase/penicillin-binding protein
VHFQYSIAAGIQHLVQQRATKVTCNQLQEYDTRQSIRTFSCISYGKESVEATEIAEEIKKPNKIGRML